MNREKGQTSIIVLVVLFIAGVVLLQQNIPTNKASSVKEKCKIDPVDTSQSVTHDGAQYDLIRSHSALSTEQFGWHMKELKFITYAGESRRLFRGKVWAESEPAHPEKPPGDIAGFADNSAKDLIFLQESNSTSAPPGYIFVDIFLKRGVEVPNFIKNFCESGQPVDAIKIFPNANGFPPAHLKKGRDFNAGTDGTDFTLFAYERADSDMGKTHRGVGPTTPNGGWTQTIEINGKAYPFGFASFAGYLAIYDEGSGYIYLYSKKIPPPSPTPPASAAKNSLQLSTLEPSTLFPFAWWSPECKPAIYLYPKKETEVHVVVEPKGYLTYTDPLYPIGGWKVKAHPDGSIVSSNKNYDYLYYESKIRDTEIDKPTKGYVVKFEKLPELYSQILPRLGLSPKETQDFKDYWEKVLPQSPYYFVGIMSEKAIDKIEPLTITPRPDTIIRVRVYFEALDFHKVVQEPGFNNTQRNGFVVSEWGGIVKLHKDTEFSCSQ